MFTDLLINSNAKFFFYVKNVSTPLSKTVWASIQIIRYILNFLKFEGFFQLGTTNRLYKYDGLLYARNSYKRKYSN